MDASSGRDTAKLIALFCVAALAWEWLLAGGGVGMHEMDMGGGNVMMMRPEWTLGYAALVLAMWVVMMVAMMLPSAAPAILAVERAAPFAAGYLAVWSAFGLAATLAQFALERSDLLSDAMALRSDALAGGVVLAVGVYQLSPWKQACLRACTAGAAERDAGVWQAARLGLRYGAYCLGCCWALMVLLFVAGVMNLFWVAAIALWLTAEKLLPFGRYIARVAGAGLAAWGVALLALAV
jgi:predicted metal-binding membrane protein